LSTLAPSCFLRIRFAAVFSDGNEEARHFTLALREDRIEPALIREQGNDTWPANIPKRAAV
jgi:hypothetical protein